MSCWKTTIPPKLPHILILDAQVQVCAAPRIRPIQPVLEVRPASPACELDDVAPFEEAIQISESDPSIQDPEVHIVNDKVEVVQSEEDPHGLTFESAGSLTVE